MAQLAVVFPGLKVEPSVYYKLLDDLREDAFLGAVRKICLERTELFPTSNLVAIIREKSQEFILEKIRGKQQEDFKKIGHNPEIDEEKAEEARKEFKALMEKLAKEKEMK